MSYVLLTKEAFDELIPRVAPDPGTTYAVSFGDTCLFEGLGEVERAKVTKIDGRYGSRTSFDPFERPVPPLDESEDVCECRCECRIVDNDCGS